MGASFKVQVRVVQLSLTSGAAVRVCTRARTVHCVVVSWLQNTCQVYENISTAAVLPPRERIWQLSHRLARTHASTRARTLWGSERIHCRQGEESKGGS